MKIDQAALYTESHEWVRKDGDVYAYGITDHAQHELSDIVFVDFPAVGDSFDKGDSIGVVESVKAASDLYLPAGGEIVEVNEALQDAPESINSDPYGEGWIVKFKVTAPDDLDGLMDAAAYATFSGE
ncbi:MAG TPA: glycine cleavage system protein GcvH [Anaerolineales bacterium]|nr:glycine cleavage system protein GcvH [Anaerolineales bacterium]